MTILASARMPDDAAWVRLGGFWFEELPERIAEPYWSLLQESLPLNPDFFDNGGPPWDPQTPSRRPYARVTIAGRPWRGIRTMLYSPKRIRDAVRKRPLVVGLSLEELDTDDVPMSGAELHLDLLSPDDHPDVATFSLRRENERTDGYVTFSDAVMARAVDALHDLCRCEDLDFAAAGDSAFDGTYTHLEWALHRDHSDGMSEARTWLRGYSWITVMPREIVQRLDGPDALRESGAFAYVEELPHGGLWLRATEKIEDYDAAAVRKVFGAVAPVLPPGRPQTSWHGAHDDESWRIIQEDAANYR